MLHASAIAGEYDGQIEKYQKMVEQDATNLDAAYQLANSLAWDSRYDEAVKVYEEILTKEPKYKDAEIGIAQVYAWKGDQKGAIEKYEEILAKAPNTYEAHQGLGNLALWVNDFEKSIDEFKKALAINPNDITSLKGIGRAYLGRGDRRQAEEYFTKVQILEIRKTPLPLIVAITGGAGLAVTAIFLWFRQLSRRRKKVLLRLELKILRYAMALYQQKTGRFPLALESLSQEKWRAAGDTEDRPYLEGFRQGDRGFLTDPLGNRYWYNPDTGRAASTTKGCEEW